MKKDDDRKTEIYYRTMLQREYSCIKIQVYNEYEVKKVK